MPTEPSRPVRIWDLPTRICHWCLALLVVGMVVTGRVGGEAMPWHARMGYCVGSLLLFRLAWGFVGGHWSRFAAFRLSPPAIAAYWRGALSLQSSPGHNPLGAVAVYAFLIFLLAQVGTGLFSDDRADFSGPLSVLVSNRAVRLFTGYHKNIGQWIVIGLVLLHVGAIAFYRLRKRQDLIGPMLHGDKHLPPATRASRDDARSRLGALVVLGMSSAAMAWLVSLGGG